LDKIDVLPEKIVIRQSAADPVRKSEAVLNGYAVKSTDLLKKILYPAILLAGLMVAWQACVVSFALPPTVLPAPFAVGSALVHNFKKIIMPDLFFTMKIIGTSYTISVVLGFALAAICSQSKVLTHTVTPLSVMFMVTPTLILIPIFMIFLGFRPIVRVIVVSLQCIPIITLNTLTGFTSISKSEREMLSAHGCSRWQIFTKFTVFKAMPQIFTGLKLACIISIIAALGADFAMGKIGLGYRVKVSSSMVALDMVFATILVAAILGITMFEIVSFAEKKIVTWK
jgi:NitT/TauT family transport system permease protein